MAASQDAPQDAPGEDDRIERDGSAPPQQADATPLFVDLIGLLSDEFGISRSVIRRDLLMGEVTLDDVPVEGDPLEIVREIAAGKTLEVKGGDTKRTYRVQISS